MPERLHERMGAPRKDRPIGSLVWFHGASVGESLSALPVIEKILNDYPDCHVMVTTGTITSARLMEKRLGARAFHQFIPLDHPKWVKRFLNHWQPDAVIWLESDFWPNMLQQIQKRDIPAVLLNARMGEGSFDKWSRFAAGSLQRILSTFDMCLTQSADEKARLDHFGHPDVRISDNLKYAAARLPVHEQRRAELSDAIGARPVWQYASTHPGEEDIAIGIHQNLQKEFEDVLTVLIPRHPNRGAEIKDLADKTGVKAARRSQNEPILNDTDIYIADTMGELGIFFDLIDTTVIGGSMVAHGGHNPIEPAQFENMVIYGPHMFNFKLICEDFESRNAAMPVADAADLTQKLTAYFRAPELKRPYQNAASELTKEKSAALSRLWADLSPWLDQNRGQHD